MRPAALARLFAALALAQLALAPADAAPRRAVVVASGAIRVLPAGDAVQVNPEGIVLPHGTEPSGPLNGQCWTTAAGLFCRIAGATVGPYVSATGGGDYVPASALSAFGATLIDAASAAAARTTLGLGTLATQSGTFSGASSGINTGDQDLSGYATSAAVAAGYQPLAAVLTATTASFTAAKDSKLNGIEAGATANSADATLLARANHTGTQAAATISDFATAVDARLGSYATSAAVAAGYQPLDSDLATYAEITPSADVQALLGAASDAAFRDELGLGTLATQSGTFSGTSSGTNTGDQTSIAGITGTLAQFNAALTGADFATGGGTATGTNTGDQDLSAYATTSAVSAGYQPLDSDLTAIAGLATTAFGRGLLDDADASAARTTIGAGTGNGTVTSVSVTTANGISGSVATASTTPALTLTLGAITPSSVVASGDLSSSGGGVGYAAGNGGTVTQATSKSTAVTLNKRTGNITMNAAALAAAAIVTFTLNNSTITADDLIVATHHATGTFGAYGIACRATGAGAAACSVRNNSAGSLSEAIAIKFAVVDGVVT